MSFASLPFLLTLPIVLLGFYCIRGTQAADVRTWWLLIASVLLYAYSGLQDTAVLGLSLLLNLAVARVLIHASAGQRLRRVVMRLGVLINALLLILFKWLGTNGAGAHAGQYLTGSEVLIPLGLSFITFQQIAFLVDCYHRRIQTFRTRDYVFFITFFPQLVMGPIVQFHQLVPQLYEESYARRSFENFSVGLAIFIFGLFKKVAVADALAPVVDRIFNAAGAAPLSTLDAWAGAVGFQLQLFLDFSAYADMAIGLARMLGLNLPINFDDPYRAVNRFDLWKRWHITFVEFMRVHVYRPLARICGLPMPVALTATMLISGIWHGLGWTFVLWAVLQAAVLLCGHYWSHWRKSALGRRLPQWLLLKVVITFMCTSVLSVLFRSSSLNAAKNMFASMLAAGNEVRSVAGSMVRSTLDHGSVAALLAAVALVWIVPPAGELFSRYWSAIDPRPTKGAPTTQVGKIALRFDLSLPWGLFAGVCLVIAVFSLGHVRRFIYVQF